MNLKNATRWSVDFGNVLVKNIAREKREKISHLVSKIKDQNNTLDLDKFLLDNSFLIPNALAGLQELISRYGAENVWIVSRASGIERFINLRLFSLHRFAELTGFLPNHIYFVDLYHEKRNICHSLNIQTHIDDRGEVHFHLLGTVPNLLWFQPTKSDLSQWSKKLPQAVYISGWNEIIALL